MSIELMSDEELPRFLEWYAIACQFSIMTGIAPDDYRWNLQKCEEWEDYFERGYEPARAVIQIFPQRAKEKIVFDDDGYITGITVHAENDEEVDELMRAAFGNDIKSYSIDNLERVH